MKPHTAFVLVALTATGCIEQAPTSQANNVTSPNDMNLSDTNTQSDIGVSDDGIDDTGVVEFPDLGSDEGPARIPASDIYSRFDALWTFEEGMVAQNTSYSLTTTMTRVADELAPQGNYQLDLDRTAASEDSQELGVLQVGDKLLVGGWLRDRSGTQNSTVLSKHDTQSGGWLIAVEQGQWACGGVRVDDTIDYQPVLSGVTVNSGQWTHVACLIERENDTELKVQTFVEGNVAASGNSVYTESNQPFKIGVQGSGPYQFTGSVDEVFIGSSENAAELIRRLYACGADGQLCSCVDGNPSEYESCGRLTDCNNLPACR